MKRISFLLITVLMLSGCNKLDVNEINLQGEWYEAFDEYADFASEGSIHITFTERDNFVVNVSDVFAGDSQHEGTFSFDQEERNIIHLVYKPESPVSSHIEMEHYEIINLTKDLMEWQRVGTSYSPGTVGSNYRRFRRVK